MLGPDGLRKQRQALGLTQASLAELRGVAPNTVARWERGDKRIGHPERLWHALEQLRQRAIDLSPSTFVASTGTLPADLSSFVGREVEVAEVRRLLAANRLVTLTGAGGIGKTRLAHRVAQAEQSRYPDGVWLVELPSLVDPDPRSPGGRHDTACPRATWAFACPGRCAFPRNEGSLARAGQL
jgi:transcriptional regulator with XRE-family HTH domain